MSALEGAFRFENFVVGAPNRLAAAAARAVAETPGTTYNPLFVYGDSGLGKTHLVAAIAWHARHVQPALRVELMTGEDLVERMHQAIAQARYDRFAQQLAEVELLVLDDVQFLTGQKETQSGLLRLFNLMQSKGRQLVMTSDRQPADIPDVDQRLLSRLSGGLIVDVGTPDYEMRLAILRNSCAERGLDFAPGVLEEVARLAFTNVRELKGALNRVSAYCQLDGAAITAADVRAVLGERPRTGRASGPVAVLRADGTIAEYDGFLADVVHEVENRVEEWRVRIGEACDRWRAAGYRTLVLERALTLPVAPDVDGLLSMFESAISHLRSLEEKAVAFDPSLRGHTAFRNPETIDQAEAIVQRVLATALPLPAPQPQFTRDTFETGSANQLAMKAFDDVLREPGAQHNEQFLAQYNPLLVHGTAGTGKTHFANALANEFRKQRPDAAIACMAASTFVQELVAAMQEGGVERWRARYRSADLFVLDDIQDLEDKERTQDELFHLFNHLVARGSQIVLTSDRPARELFGLADRLRSRFEGGLVAALQVADRPMRERLVTRWLADAGEPASAALSSWIADRSAAGVRDLRALFTRLQSAARFLGIPLTLDFAQREMQGAAAPASASIAPRLEPGQIDTAFLDREKVIWSWPDPSGRLVEELR